MVEEDGVVDHKRYVNPARTLDMPFSPENIGSGWQASHETHRGALGQSLEEQRSQNQQMLKRKLAPLEWI